jgi:hypothetical protein
LAEEHDRELETTKRLPKERTAPRKGMNAHQVEAWYDGLKEGRDGSARNGIGGRLVVLFSGLLNVLLVYAVIQLAASLPSIERQSQTAMQEKKGEEGLKRAGEAKVEAVDAKKAKRDPKR